MDLLLLILAIYLLLGALFALPFVFVGVNQIDSSASDSSLTFRLVIMPGVIALWPLMLLKWLGARKQLDVPADQSMRGLRAWHLALMLVLGFFALAAVYIAISERHELPSNPALPALEGSHP